MTVRVSNFSVETDYSQSSGSVFLSHLHSVIAGNSILPQVVVNVAIGALSSYAKVGVAVQLHADKINKDVALLANGVFTQLGSMLGALLFFILVNFTDLF